MRISTAEADTVSMNGDSMPGVPGIRVDDSPASELHGHECTAAALSLLADVGLYHSHHGRPLYHTLHCSP